MTDEPYKPPQSDLLAGSVEANQKFYVVSRTKLSILYIATFGLYSVYWFYKNWRNYKDVMGAKIMPAPRSLFFIFFTHSLFRKIDLELKTKDAVFEWAPRVLATLFVITSIVSNVLDRASFNGIGSPWTDILSFGTLFVALLILAKAQAAINLSQDDPDGNSNHRLTLFNYIWIVLGSLIWLLVIVGYLGLLGIISFEG